MRCTSDKQQSTALLRCKPFSPGAERAEVQPPWQHTAERPYLCRREPVLQCIPHSSTQLGDLTCACSMALMICSAPLAAAMCRGVDPTGQAA